MGVVDPGWMRVRRRIRGWRLILIPLPLWDIELVCLQWTGDNGFGVGLVN